MNNEKIVVIGNGAIGKALAVFLKLEKRNVILVRGSIDDGSSYFEDIAVNLQDKTQLRATIEVSTISNFKTIEGLVVLTNKSFGNEAIANSLKQKIGNSPVVILQNGLGIEKVFVDHDFPGVYRCVLFATSQVVEENRVNFKPVSVCPIGIIKGTEETLHKITRVLTTEKFQFKPELDIQRIIWKKAIANCVFNSICPLLEIDNGVFYRDASVMEIAKRIIAECISISKQLGIALEQNEVEESVLQISRSSDGQLISTLQDIIKHSKTEIETLNLEIARLASTLGKEELVKETKIVGELIKIKSEQSLRQANSHENDKAYLHRHTQIV